MNKEIIWNIILLAGLLFFFIAFGMMIVEFYGAKSFCSGQEEQYFFNFKEINHYCGENKIFLYKNGWDFDRNWSISLP